MKKQINPTIKAHLLRGAFYLLLLLAVCAIPFALGQSRSRGTSNRSVAGLPSYPNLSATGPAVAGNPDFAPPGFSKVHSPGIPTSDAAALASGAVATTSALLAPMSPEGGCGLPGPWSTATPGPPARYRAGSCTDGQYVYVYGGGNSTAGFTYNDLWRWNPVTQVWTQLANMPTGKQNIQGAYWNGKIYVPGGFVNATATHITENAIYDIATNTWSTGAPLPAAQTGTNVAFNNKIYNFGGNPGPQSTVTIYDIATNTWSNGAAMPVPITYGRATVSTVLGQYAYYAGGIAGGVTVNTLYRYDLAANTWATMAPLQTARTSEELMTSPFGDQLYAVMGGDATFFTGVPQPQSVEIYSIGPNSWSYGNPVVTKAAAPSGGRPGGQATLMVQGGVDNTTYYDTVQVSVVPCGTPTPTATGTPSPTPTATATPCTGGYTIAQIGGSIVPGTTDIGNHGDDTVTTIALPFSYTLYDQSFTSINLSSNGNAQFTTTDTTFTNQCLPWLTHNYTIYPYWDDLYLVNSPSGIFTSISGTAPNRIFNIEWRAQYFPGSGNANFELRLYEGQTRFDVIYGGVDNGNTSATAGVQKNDTTFTQYFCNGAGGAATGGQSYTSQPCGSPTPTATGTPSCTAGWQTEPSLANARRNPATVAVGSNLYAITGFNAAPDYTAVNERFNGSSWTAMAPIPVPHAQSRGTVLGTNIYVPGGFNSISFGGPLDTLQIYNTATDTWSSGATMPGTRGGVATASFNGMVYIIAGYTTPFPTATNTVFIYNPGTNSYTMGAPMPATQGNQVGVLFNGEIYVVGGGAAPGAQYAYNPTTNTWRTIAALPTTGGTCQSDAGFVLDNELWVVGCLGLAINQQVWIYNPGTDSWRAGPPYNVDHQGPGGALFNGRGFVVGGGSASGGSTAVESVGGCGGQSPTPTATATATATSTATPTSTSCPTVTSTPTATATATATAELRPTPTPRPRPTPAPRP